jgi:hypothetical protein
VHNVHDHTIGRIFWIDGEVDMTCQAFVSTRSAKTYTVGKRDAVSNM